MNSNKTLVEKANLEVSDLISDGGYLPTDVAREFVVDMIKESVMMRQIKVETLKSHTKTYPKIGISGKVLKPGTSGQALAAADRVKPATDDVTLNTHLMKAEIRLNDEVLEDNVEGGTLKTTIMNMFKEHMALDMDDVIVNGDDSGTTGTVLDLMDGMLVSATSHVVNGGTVTINDGMFRDAVKEMPSQYNREKRKQKFFSSEDAETDWRDVLSQRGTALGDKYVNSDTPTTPQARPFMPVPIFPDNLGVGTNTTNMLLLNPKNAIWGIWRKIKIESDRDITSGEWIAVASVRAGFQYLEEDAVVKVTNILTQ